MKKKNISILTILICLSVSEVIAQYDYGLEICNQDVKISGKVNLSDADGNVFIGDSTGFNNVGGSINVFVGKESGFKNTVGNQNTFIGAFAGRGNRIGISNTITGYRAGQNTLGNWNTVYGAFSRQVSDLGDNNTLLGAISFSQNSGANNVGVGFKTGQKNQLGSGNVFLGYESGMNELGSNRLYIENSNSETPLIYGEFDNDKVEINGSLHIKEFANLAPGAAPASPVRGTIYYDDSDDKVKVWTGAVWENLN